MSLHRRDELVLVTGGAGFIGSHVVDRLIKNGYAVRVIDDLSTGKLANIEDHVKKGEVDFVRGDIREAGLVRKSVRGVSAVLHLAAITSVPFSVKNPELTGDVNVGGTLNLLYACVKEKVGKFVFASTCAVYGDSRSLPVRESHVAEPISPYAQSKVMAEDFCLGFHVRQLLKSVVLRLFNVYGPRQGLNEYSGVITRFFAWCRQGLPLIIYGDGFQTRDFVHVYDVADFFLRVLESNEAGGQVFNVGYGKPITILELAHVCSKVNDCLPNIVHAEPAAGDIRHSFADISKAQQLLGYKPNYALEDGLLTLADEFWEKIVQ